MEYLSTLSQEQLARIERVITANENKNKEDAEREKKEAEERKRLEAEVKRNAGNKPKTKTPKAPVTPPVSAPINPANYNPSDYIIVEGANGLYGTEPRISKFELIGMNNLNWENTHIKLSESGLYMPTSQIFMQHFENVVRAKKEGKTLRQADGKPVPTSEREEIYKHLTTNFKDIYGHNNSGAWTWLNDMFELEGDKWYVKHVVEIENRKLKFAPRKSLESCLDKDCWADFKLRTSQGFPMHEKGKSYLQGKNIYFYKPVDERVAGFGANSGGAGLFCDWDRTDSDSSLGVFACAEGTVGQKISGGNP